VTSPVADTWTHRSLTEQWQPGGLLRIAAALGPDGLLRVEDTYQAIIAGDHPDPSHVDAYLLTLRCAWLDGNLVEDPRAARALADAAGLAGPPMFTP
jgi:hypothetical protein